VILTHRGCCPDGPGCKLVLVNNQMESDPLQWPVEGDTNMDCG